MSDEKYEASYVHDMLNVWDDEFEGSLRARSQLIIVDTLLVLPKPDIDKVLEDVIFVIMSGACGASVFQHVELKQWGPQVRLPKGRIWMNVEVQLILLNFALMERYEFNDEKMRSIVAHEIAHFILEHHKTSVISQAEKEKQANEMIEEWGFDAL